MSRKYINLSKKHVSGVKQVLTTEQVSWSVKQDIEYLSVVDRIMDVFILVGRRQQPLPGPLEDHRVRVLQAGSPWHV